MKLSRHFRDRWKERVNKPIPTSKEIEGMVDGAVFIQRCRDLFTARGMRQRILSVYWVTDQGIIIKLDEKTGVVVTVLTPDMVDEELV